jgi:uncharacterized protein YbcV (DUF1398 family)
MDSRQKDVAIACLAGASTGSMSFPEIVGSLMDAGFESYSIDLRRARATCFLPDGDAVDLSTGDEVLAVAPSFDAGAVKAAIAEAQALAPGYTYKGFCRKVATAGCAGYVVSFSGRRAVYFGRTGETHVEHFPD